MTTCINSGWAKLDKYYALTSETPAYIGALVLHPAFKWQYIQEHWEEAWWQPSVCTGYTLLATLTRTSTSLLGGSYPHSL
jgi:hypothetical protein